MEYSYCCDAKIINGICSSCHENADPENEETCPACEGQGCKDCNDRGVIDISEPIKKINNGH